MNIAFFGSSLVSAYWNGAATYYRGLIRALAKRGHSITFYESDAFDRQRHRDAPATLDRVHTNAADPFLPLIPRYDFVFTYGGGPPVIEAYTKLGAQVCVPIYNALDPSTHHPVDRDARFAADLGFLGNRLPDREARVEEFFLKPAAKLAGRTFLLGGAGWQDKPMPVNVKYVGHVYTRDHNA